jgi:hypothetical protein
VGFRSGRKWGGDGKRVVVSDRRRGRVGWTWTSRCLGVFFSSPVFHPLFHFLSVTDFESRGVLLTLNSAVNYVKKVRDF